MRKPNVGLKVYNNEESYVDLIMRKPYVGLKENKSPMLAQVCHASGFGKGCSIISN